MFALLGHAGATWTARETCSPRRSSIGRATDLKRATTPDQWIITDAQFVAALANRDTPPWLVDTSFTRVLSGYLSSQELMQAGADARVHAVLFATNRLTAAPIARFHSWVAEHFSLRRTYGDGIELWTR